MIIHTVRSPFLCREGQFNEGKRDLCVGLDYNTVKANKSFCCYLGKNKKTHYEIDSVKALEVGQTWTNPRGKTVIIVPVSEFKKIESRWKKEEYEKKEVKRADIIKQSLFG